MFLGWLFVFLIREVQSVTGYCYGAQMSQHFYLFSQFLLVIFKLNRTEQVSIQDKF